MSTSEAAAARPVYKRKMRNYLLDVGLQLRYTATIVVVAIFLTAGLGFKMYQATREISRIILFTGLADPATAQELQQQFANSDRIVLWGIIGFGIVLVLSISAVGILITHKVVGPLYKISSLFARVRDNRMSAAPAGLRKGDELQDFYTGFREMHEAVRARVVEDVNVVGAAVAAIETSGAASTPAVQRALDELRQLKKRKEESLEAPITGDRAVAMDHGPVLSHVYDLVKGKAARAGDIDTLWRIYDKHIKKAEPQAELGELVSLVKSGKRIALLCYCRNPAACHRSRIVANVKKRVRLKSEDLIPPLF